jgi:hypothetical protein
MCEDDVLYELEDDDEERLKSYAESEEKRLRDYLNEPYFTGGVSIGQLVSDNEELERRKQYNKCTESKPKAVEYKPEYKPVVHIPVKPPMYGHFEPPKEPLAEHMNMLGNPTKPPNAMGYVIVPVESDSGTGHAYPRGIEAEVVMVSGSHVLVRPDENYPFRFCLLERDDFKGKLDISAEKQVRQKQGRRKPDRLFLVFLTAGYRWEHHIIHREYNETTALAAAKQKSKLPEVVSSMVTEIFEHNMIEGGY